ncbi:protein-l-isoaspartate(d-aspartate) o-methyltransferase [Purpureocillium lavendulum]|uniref:Protein-l-isoaspartate(D-aspartate) o-methyltransferase n=1 Tax=Purpureocillium lavendulum TaxID=1247861 RepID=A0AB34FV72_9HYPO|nr:protein-l-isoaspartate(d-aspartate) o-methyltransferase [Purpureocillium lavendulum]
MAPAQSLQYACAQHMYANRADDYDSSWHASYTARFMELAAPQPGERVLALACGTGLEAEHAAPLVGEPSGGGLVVGVDATPAMLDVFRRKRAADPVLAARTRVLQHDVTDLSGFAGVEPASFDLIVCSNAFVLFDDPAAVVRHWKTYLRDGGRMVIDVTHERNLHQGLLMEAVAERMGVAFPSDRRWITSRDSFRRVLEAQGLRVERVEALEKVSGKGTVYLGTEEADAQFDYITSMPLSSELATEEFKQKARPLFKEEWQKAAVDGKLEVCDILYVYVARKI